MGDFSIVAINEIIPTQRTRATKLFNSLHGSQAEKQQQLVTRVSIQVSYSDALENVGNALRSGAQTTTNHLTKHYSVLRNFEVNEG